MAEGGWIKVYRGIRKHWLWQDGNERYLKWWIDLLMMVNHEPKKVLVNGTLVIVGIGERLTSIRKLSKHWGASTHTVAKFLDLLKADEMISLRKTRTDGTTVKVLNYAAYQRKPDEENSDTASGSATPPATGNGAKVQDLQQTNGTSLLKKANTGSTTAKALSHAVYGQKQDGKNSSTASRSATPSATRTATPSATRAAYKQEPKELKESKNITTMANIFEFWENNGFGMLSPKNREDLVYWVEDFKKIGAGEADALAVVKEAIKLAIDNNVRRYSYVNRILQNWEAQKLTTVSAIAAAEAARHKRTQEYGSQQSSAGHLQKIDLTAEQEASFKAFWDAYPRKEAQESAKTAYAVALNVAKADAHTLETQAAAYAASVEQEQTERQYIALPANWLNKKRWTDDYSQAQPPITTDKWADFDPNDPFDEKHDPPQPDKWGSIDPEHPFS